MKHSISLIFILFSLPCFSQVEIDIQQLRLLNLGNTDSDLGIHWGEESDNTFGLVYDGEGFLGDNVLHLRKYIDGGPSNIMSFKVNGKVGIGTQDPLFKTVIKETKNALNTDSVSIANLALVLEKGSDFDNQGIGMGFQSSSDRNTLGAAILFERTGSASKGHLHFATKSSSAADEDIPIRMTIEDFGNVGIGVTDPEAKLHIGGNSGDSEILLENEGNLKWKTSTGSLKDILSVGADDHTTVNAVNDIIFNSGGTIAGAFRAMTIKADNKIGIGTINPLWTTVIKETANAITGGATIDVSNLAMVFAKETNDNNEGIGIGFQSSSDEENVGAAIVHERTGGSSQGKLHFGSKTSTGAGDDIQVNMTISDNGNVGIGTVTPVHALDVAGTTRSVDIICGSTALCSDERYKKDFKSFENPILLLKALNGYFHYWRNEEFPEWHFSTKRQIGFKAQEVQEILPELVSAMPDGFLAVEYSKLIPVIVEAIKEQQIIIDSQDQDIDSLKSQLEKRDQQFASLLSRIKQLENYKSANTED